MQNLKKYSAVLLLLVCFPIFKFIASSFILESDNQVYQYIPIESDVVIEINPKNFISEIAYQRIFNEIYFLEKVTPKETTKDKIEPLGIDLFSKIILFREKWSTEDVWIAILSYSDKAALQRFLFQINPSLNVIYQNGFAFAQLTPSNQQDKLDLHLQKIANREIKPFTERVNLPIIFDGQNEINCYFIPQATASNQLIDGYLYFNFLPNKIDIGGSFTPIPEFESTSTLAYERNDSVAFSLRSSLNIFKSLYWFSDEKMDNLPDYCQMALDYNGVECFLINRNAGYNFPFKSYPQISAQFDILEPLVWQAYLDSLVSKNLVSLKDSSNELYTKQGAIFNYELNQQEFVLRQDSFHLKPSLDTTLYLDFQMKIAPILDNMVFAVDLKNPPSQLEQTIGMAIVGEVIEEIRTMANISSLNFQLKKSLNNEILAHGEILMNEQKGHSVVESISFGTSALRFATTY
jgi:hypothetical protein